MKKLVAGTFLTLDGVMQAPGDSQEDIEGDFRYGGWQLPLFDEDAGAIMTESMAAMDAMLLGRVTYQIFAAYWPFAPADDPAAIKLNSVPKYVVSTTLDKVTWNNSALIRGNLTEEVTRLKQGLGEGYIWVTGSSKLAQSLMREGLIDEYVLWIHPVVLGSGKRLFSDLVSPLYLKLIDVKTTGSGILVLTYRPDGNQSGSGVAGYRFT